MLSTYFQIYSVGEWKYMSTLCHLHHILFFFINIDFRVRRNVPQSDEFLFNGINRENFIKFPQLIWIELKTPLCFESASFKILTIAHNFLATSPVEMASLRLALPNLQYARSVRLPQWVLVLFVFFSSFLDVITRKLYAFSKNLNIALFHDSAVCNGVSAQRI